jgi:D-tagatose-1,6-bisphosphate aldolase subunit GatZ/KbaZ
MYLDEIVQAQHRGEARGIPSICSAHPDVLKTALELASQEGTPALIEATCNQVNQFGGYTALTPAEFATWITGLAREFNLPPDGLILGGDHLGPSPWQNESSRSAMQKASDLVRHYVQAGFVKIHLDCSMRLHDDPAGRLDPAIVADRAAELAIVAEDNGGGNLRYVIGSEVPIPGGALAAEETASVSDVDSVHETIELHRAAFVGRGLGSAWDRVLAVVVQPGVEFGDEFISAYDPVRAEALKRCIEGWPMVYEAHSTDYQSAESLHRMIKDHFAILKVGPALTFAYREALFDLAGLEDRLVPESERSNLLDVLEQEMLRDPGHWQKYYTGSEEERALKRRHSRSDRIRYYWRLPRVEQAVQQLMTNLEGRAIPPELSIREEASSTGATGPQGTAPTAAAVISARIAGQLLPYFEACRGPV